VTAQVTTQQPQFRCTGRRRSRIRPGTLATGWRDAAGRAPRDPPGRAGTPSGEPRPGRPPPRVGVRTLHPPAGRVPDQAPPSGPAPLL